MSFLNGASPRRSPAENVDIEAGHSNTDDDGDFSDPFDIGGTKHASINRLKRWRVRFLFLLMLMNTAVDCFLFRFCLFVIWLVYRYLFVCF